MLLKTILQKQSKLHNIRWETIEQDYILSWVLEGISAIEELQRNLVFKGGTALKKIYFGNYRFSQDLDFSIINPDEIQESLPILINKACRYVTDKLKSLGENINIIAEPYLERLPHPEGQQAFTIKAKMPWHRDFHTTVYAEFSYQEIILLRPNLRKIIHPYGNDLEGKIFTYPLEEIVAEKIRALLQFSIKLHERGWGRSRVRDYYDLWRIVIDFQDVLDWSTIPDLTQSKCIYKHVVYNGIDDIFQEKLMTNVDNEWEKWLSAVVTDLPPKEEVIAVLKQFFKNNLKWI